MNYLSGIKVTSSRLFVAISLASTLSSSVFGLDGNGLRNDFLSHRGNISNLSSEGSFNIGFFDGRYEDDDVRHYFIQDSMMRDKIFWLKMEDRYGKTSPLLSLKSNSRLHMDANNATVFFSRSGGSMRTLDIFDETGQSQDPKVEGGLRFKFVNSGLFANIKVIDDKLANLSFSGNGQGRFFGKKYAFIGDLTAGGSEDPKKMGNLQVTFDASASMGGNFTSLKNGKITAKFVGGTLEGNFNALEGAGSLEFVNNGRMVGNLGVGENANVIFDDASSLIGDINAVNRGKVTFKKSHQLNKGIKLGRHDDAIVMQGNITTSSGAIVTFDKGSMQGVVFGGEASGVSFDGGSLYGTYVGTKNTNSISILKITDGYLDALSYKSGSKYGKNAISMSGGKSSIVINEGGVIGDITSNGDSSSLSLNIKNKTHKMAMYGGTVGAISNKGEKISNMIYLLGDDSASSRVGFSIGDDFYANGKNALNSISVDKKSSIGFGTGDKRSVFTAQNGGQNSVNFYADTSYVDFVSSNGGVNNFSIYGANVGSTRIALDVGKIENDGITNIAYANSEPGADFSNLKSLDGNVKIGNIKNIGGSVNMAFLGSGSLSIGSLDTRDKAGQVNLGYKLYKDSPVAFSLGNIFYSGGEINAVFGSNVTKGEDGGTIVNMTTSKIFGFDYKDGMKITLKDRMIKNDSGEEVSALGDKSAGFSIKDAVDSLNIDWRGRVIGNIGILAKSGGSLLINTFNNTLEEGSVLLGYMNETKDFTINLNFKEGSKLILAGRDPSSLGAIQNLSFRNVDVDSKAMDLSVKTLSSSTMDQKNTIIDLATEGNSVSHIAKRDYFKVLTIGAKDDKSAGFSGNNALFRLYMDVNAKKISDSVDYKLGMSDVVVIENVKKTTEPFKDYIQVIQDPSNVVTGDFSDRNIVVAKVKEDTLKGDLSLLSQNYISGFKKVGQNFISYRGDDGYTYYKIGTIGAELSRGSKEISRTALGLGYTIFESNINSLNKRMGELRENANSQGVWARVFNGKETNKELPLDITSTYTTFQAGYDYGLGGVGSNDYIGFAVGYGMLDSNSSASSEVNVDNTNSFSSKSGNIEFGIYNSYVSDDGIYTDTIAKLSMIDNSLTISNLTQKEKSDNYGLSIGQEVGYRAYLFGKSFYVDPQAEVVLGYLSSTSLKEHTQGQELDADAKAITTLRSRVGATFGYSLKTQSGFSEDFRLGGSYIYDYNSGGDAVVMVAGLDPSIASGLASDGRFALNLGTNIQAGENTRVYLDVEKSFGGKINTDYLVNAGVRYSFGDSSYTPNTEYKETKEAMEEIARKGIYVKVLDTKNALSDSQKELLSDFNYKISNAKDGSHTKYYLIGSYKDRASAKEAKESLDELAKKLGSKAEVMEVK